MNKKNKSVFISILLVLSVLLAGCGGDSTPDQESSTEKTSSEENLSDASFEELIEEADGTTVSFYGWGGDEALNRWLDEVYAVQLKEKYNITLDRVPMDIDEVLNILSTEKQVGETEGTVDMIWINGENFQTAMENEFLYGPFTQQLDNYQDYVNEEDPENQQDFGYPIDGHEAPYGKAQFVFIKDEAVAEETPKNAEDLLEFAKNYQGQVTYPALPDFTGSSFVRNIIYEFVDSTEFEDMEADKEVVAEAIEPAFEYLRELNPYLWNEGQTFPSDQPQLNNMFMDGEVVLMMSYGAYDVAVAIENGEYPETAQSFIFENGTVGNTNFIAIAGNSTNKAGAMVAINEMLSPEMQSSKYEQLRTLPVLDHDSLSEGQQALFDEVDLGPGTIPQDELLSARLPEMPGKLVPIIEELWLEEVVGQYNE